MTTMALPIARGRMWTVVTVAAGVTLGVAYTLSPLTVLSLGVLICATVAASRGLSEGERRWFWCLIAGAVLLRLAAVALLFYFADPTHPFASFFGDEELYKFRSVWLRNLGQSIPISPADAIYSYDDVGRTGHLFVLALVQAMVGDAPYGLHVLSMTLYLCGAIALYRFARAAFGAAPALAGLIGLLFLPSLTLWSISVLKEPMNVFVLVGELLCAVSIVRAPDWRHKAIAAAGVLVLALAMESLRGGGLITAAVGTLGGLSLVFLLVRGRRVLIAVMVAVVAIPVLANWSAFQDRVVSNLRAAAFHHAGHVLTPGYSYQLLNPHYYPSRTQILHSLPPVEAGRFAVKALWSYVVEPLPWRAESRALTAYLPEQFAWYVMVLVAPFGILAGLRRDIVLTSMLVAHAAAAMIVVALTSGNLGTLIRHRSLVLLYLIWLSVLGAQECLRRVIDGRGVREEGSRVDGDR